MKIHTLYIFHRSHFIAVLLSLIVFQVSFAQTPMAVLENRLTKTWKLDRTVQNDQSQKADVSLSDFVMILNPDHTAKQGMNPDGLIAGKWSVDEKRMVLSIRDDVTAQEYKMKISALTSVELILEDTLSNPVMFIHYRSK